MIRKALLLRIYDAANMQRWNDKIRPVELRELDKQAHKMVIAYFLGKFEESEEDFDWISIIEGGLFEFLQRLVLTDLKPQILYRIKEDRAKYALLNRWVYQQLEPIISPLGEPFCNRFKSYLEDTDESLPRRILSAAHFYATKWEFDIIERANPGGYEIQSIKTGLEQLQERYYDLKGLQQLTLFSKYRNFIDLCGQLRFQLRWSHIHRVPATSVLGHMLVVALLSYLFSLEIGGCRVRRVNNYFNGLFHDLPEILTRDIISPVKRAVEGLSDLIKEYEREQMEREVYGLIPAAWHAEMRLFTENEFKSSVTIDGRPVIMSSNEINERCNEDRFSPRDGELIEAADHLAAYIEAYMAIKNGMTSPELDEAKASLRGRYRKFTIAGLKFGEVYADFE